MLSKLKNFIKKFKKWIIYFLLGGTALAAGLGVVPENPDTIIASKLVDIQSLMETDKQSNGKYKYRPKEIVQPLFSEATTYEVHEYETSKGELGYTIFIEKTEGGIIYKKAIATGVEKTSREFDWKIIENKTASTASTTP